MSNWVTEEEMYKIILDNNLLMETIDAENDSNILVLPQEILNNRGDRPDFIVLHIMPTGEKIIHIVEVKITASLDLLMQQKKYDNAVFQLIAENPDIRDVEIRTSIIYRFIYSKLKPFLEDEYKGWLFFRLEQNDGVWGFSFEDESSPKLKESFVKNALNFFGGAHG